VTISTIASCPTSTHLPIMVAYIVSTGAIIRRSLPAFHTPSNPLQPTPPPAIAVCADTCYNEVMSITLTDTIKVNGLPSSEEWKIIVHSAKEGGYWGEVPALRGCASFGATRSECRANVREAAIGCLEVYFEEAFKKFSMKMPAPPKRTQVRA